MLHLSKVAVGCASCDALAERQRARLAGGVVPVTTRYRPKRAEELVGGSLYWIVRHRLVARNRILGFSDGADGRVVIELDPELVRVEARAKRAHQGWRYLPEPPGDLVEGEAAGLPDALAAELVSLALL